MRPRLFPGGDAQDGTRGASSGDDPKTWTLPLQSYMPDEKQQRMLTEARALVSRPFSTSSRNCTPTA
ncbi:hypothetical protein [Streptomyces sp. NPDC014676]|uniref:hypothetical protein n=1 Tax=Streptomyces sp. NPDC014676 TaxID=3364879 RepID=UPI0036FAF8C9